MYEKIKQGGGWMEIKKGGSSPPKIYQVTLSITEPALPV